MERKCSRKKRLNANLLNTKARSRKSTSNNLMNALRNHRAKRCQQKDLISQMKTYIQFIKEYKNMCVDANCNTTCEK